MFLQWLDVVHQCMSQCPGAFQFTQDLLVLLADAANSSWFGDFLGECERERDVNCIRESTLSVWKAVDACAALVLNPSYLPVRAMLRIDPRVRALRLWGQYYLRWPSRVDAVVFAHTTRGRVSAFPNFNALASLADAGLPGALPAHEDGDETPLMDVMTPSGEDLDEEAEHSPEDDPAALAGAASWVPDRMAATCYGCDAEFTLTRRKHRA